jgi:nitroreductase
MDTFEAIITRRSIRKFEAKVVEPENIQKLLTAAMYAPSARNTQSWQYIVITERSILNAIMDVHPYAQMMAEATLAILVCGDKTLEQNEGYLNTNCSAATQNILLAANASGLGSVWLGIYPRQERMKAIACLFKIPEHVIPISLIALGYPAEKKSAPARYLSERVHYNKW